MIGCLGRSRQCRVIPGPNSRRRMEGCLIRVIYQKRVLFLALGGILVTVDRALPTTDGCVGNRGGGWDKVKPGENGVGKLHLKSCRGF